MTTKLIEYLKKGDVASFKEEVEAILNTKVLQKVDQIRSDLQEDMGTQEVKDFFEFIGGEEYEETEDYCSAILPNKAALNSALLQISQYAPDLDFDIFYYADVDEEPNPEIPYYPHDEDEEDHTRVDVDLADIPDLDAGDAFELVVYKHGKPYATDADDAPVEYSAYESLITQGEVLEEGQKFTNAQIAALKTEFDKIKKVDPASTHYKKLNKFVKGLPKDIQKQLIDANVKWVSQIAQMAEGFLGGRDEWLKKRFDYKSAVKNFESIYGPDQGIPLWIADKKDGGPFWMNSVSGEVLPAKEKTKPKNAKEYSGNPMKPIKEGYIGDKTDMLIDKLFQGKHGVQLSAAYNDQNKKAVDAVLKKAKLDQISINKVMKKMFGAHSRLATESTIVEASWVNIANMQNTMLKGKYGTDLKKAINKGDKKGIANIGAKYKKENLLRGSDEYFDDAVKGLQGFRGIPEDFDALAEANENEGGRMIKRRVSFAKKKRGGKLVNRRQRRRKGKVSQGAGKGYKAKGAGWKTKLIQANRKRKISKRKNVKAQKMGKRFAARSRNIRKKLGFRSGT